jgi:hypothetical protein
MGEIGMKAVAQRSTNGDMNLGIMNLTVGFAPLKPTESAEADHVGFAAVAASSHAGVNAGFGRLYINIWEEPEFL